MYSFVLLFQLTELLEGLWSKDDEYDVYKTELIVIGPMDQFRQISTGTGTSKGMHVFVMLVCW